MDKRQTYRAKELGYDPRHQQSKFKFRYRSSIHPVLPSHSNSQTLFTGEWDGANLCISMEVCIVIIPLVSSKTEKEPFMAVETAMAEYNTIVTNTLGARPRSILRSCLHDIRFLLLRMSYGEALGADCGGGSFNRFIATIKLPNCWLRMRSMMRVWKLRDM